jgi:hypothetical protein
MKKLALIISVLLLNPGCSVFHLGKLSDTHQESCGPKAVRDALHEIHKDIRWKKDPFSKKEISQEIQKSGNLSRIFLSTFNYSAFEITWPCEIEKYFNKRNINFKKINKIQDIKDLNKTVIFLVKGATLRGEWHWITFPTYSLDYIERVFGDRTEIVLGYIIDER